MTPRPNGVRRHAWSIVIATTLVTGCGVAGRATVEGEAGATPSPNASVDASLDPAPAATTSRPPSALPDSSAAASTTGRPPDAALSAEGGEAVVGELGSYTWADGGSDAPWLPGAPIDVGAREPLAVMIAGSPSIASWTVRKAAADSVGDAGARLLAEATDGWPIAFPAPEPGAWTLQTTVRFAEGGSATYYWRVDVP